MVCTVTSTARSGAYRIATTYLADPDRDTVLVRVQYTPLVPAARAYRLHVRLEVRRRDGSQRGARGKAVDDGHIHEDAAHLVAIAFAEDSAVKK